MPPGMIPDDDASYYEEEPEGLAPIEESEDSYDSGGATKGSDEQLSGAGSRLGMNEAASHSTVVIRPPILPNGQAAYDEAVTDAEVEAAGLGAPPAYETPGVPAQQSQQPVPAPSPPPSPSSARRRSTHAERTSISGRGTALRPGDLGNGIDTIRPVKRVDAAGSLKLSAEYVGAVRESAENGVRMNGSVDGKDHRRKASDTARAGRAMIDDVVVPVVQNVRPFTL